MDQDERNLEIAQSLLLWQIAKNTSNNNPAIDRGTSQNCWQCGGPIPRIGARVCMHCQCKLSWAVYCLCNPTVRIVSGSDVCDFCERGEMHGRVCKPGMEEEALWDLEDDVALDRELEAQRTHVAGELGVVTSFFATFFFAGICFCIVLMNEERVWSTESTTTFYLSALVAALCSFGWLGKTVLSTAHRPFRSRYQPEITPKKRGKKLTAADDDDDWEEIQEYLLCNNRSDLKRIATSSPIPTTSRRQATPSTSIWFIKRESVVKGPVAVETLKRLVKEKKLKSTDQLASSKNGPWEPIKTAYSQILKQE